MGKTRGVKKGLFKRKVHGENYYGGPWFGSKRDAKANAEKARKHGMKAIVIPVKDGYRVLDRMA